MLERIDRYELKERIGVGGQATVYLGEDTVLGRTVAVKVMNQIVSSEKEYADALMSEARLVAGLSHPNIATVHDFKIEGDVACIVMEYVPNSLDRELKSGGAMTPSRAVDIAIQVCDALAYAHSEGFVHRDIKPHNILLTSDGTPKVADFGIARATNLSVTTSLGTPLYMSPEQCRGDESPDVRSDIYSLGVTLYEMLSGQAPFHGSVPQLYEKHIKEPVPEFPPEFDIPKNLDAIVRKCMEKEPDARYQDSQEISAALRGLSERPVSRAASAAAQMGKQGVGQVETEDPVPTGHDWRRQGRYTVLGETGRDDRQGFRRKVQAGADEMVIVRKNGEITDVYSEARRPTRSVGEFLKSLIGLGPNTEVYKATKTRFNIVFWLGDDDTVATGHKSFAFGLPVLTSDNQVIPARINLWLEIDEDLAENTLLLLRGQNVLNRFDIATEIRDDLLAKVLALDLSQYTFDELRGNRSLLQSLGNSIQREISGTIGAFGLRIQDYSISWGLTLQERADLDQQKHQVSLDQVKSLNAIDKISDSDKDEKGRSGPVEVILTQNPSRWARIIAILGVVSALIFLTINATRVMDQASALFDTKGSVEVVEGITPLEASKLSVPTAVPVSGNPEQSYPIVPRSGGGYESVLPAPQLADLAHLSRLHLQVSTLPGNVESLAVNPVALNTIPEASGFIFLRAMNIEILGHGSPGSVPSSIDFQVKKQWLEDESISTDNIVLLRRTETESREGSWVELPTAYVGSVLGTQDQFYEKFSAETPGFSVFAISIKIKQPLSKTVPGAVNKPTATPFPAPQTSAVLFPDKRLHVAVRRALGKGEGDQITKQDLLKVTELIADSKGISDLSGIENLKNLELLGLFNNQISDVSPLSSLTNLQYLYLTNNQISDVGPLSSLTNLTELGISDNQISDVGPLSSLTNLTYLDISHNQITDLGPVESLPIVSDLNTEGNPTGNKAGASVIFPATPDGYLGYRAGVRWGTISVPDNGEGFRIGDHLFQKYTLAHLGDQIGWFYGNNSGYPEPTIYVAGLTDRGACDKTEQGYQGFFNEQLRNASNSQFTSFDENLKFGASSSGCYTGKMFFAQGGHLGVLDPISINSNGTLLMNWWLGDEGVTDLSKCQCFGTEVLESEASNSTLISGKLMYNNEPLSNYSSAVPKLRLFGPRKGDGDFSSVKYFVETTYDSGTGRYEVSSADIEPGDYLIEVSFSGSTIVPDGLIGIMESFAVRAGQDGKIGADVDIDIARIIHITSPWDNMQTAPYQMLITTDQLYRHAAKDLHFEWDNILEAKAYEVEIERVKEVNKQSELAVRRTIEKIPGKSTYLDVSLPVLPEGEYYRLNVWAHGEFSARVGQLRVRLSNNGTGSGYLFLVEEKPEQTATLFSDPALYGVIRRALGKSEDDLITKQDLLEVTELIADSKGISDLSGIENLKNLEVLNLVDNDISDVNPLSSLTNLRELYLHGNQISDVGPLSSLTNLTDLGISDNQISDISPVESLPKLDTLEIKGNPIQTTAQSVLDFPDLGLDEAVRQVLGKSSDEQITKAELAEITELRANSISITDLTGIENLTNLEKLYIYNNQISDVSLLSELTGLKALYIGSNQISDVSPLSSLTNLQTLYLNGNQISDISPLSSLISLETLSVTSNQITDISPLTVLTGLRNLAILNNYELTDVSPLKSLTGLISLELSDKPLSEIPRLPNLERIRIWRIFWADSSVIDQANAIEEFAKNRPNLRMFQIYASEINDLSVLSPLHYLTGLEVSGSDLFDLSPLSSFTNLTTLYLSNNQISNISPLSSLTNLNTLFLYSNQISDVSPLESLTNLTSLHISNNQISDVNPLSSLTNLRSLYLTNNDISDVNPLSSLTNLRELYLHGNQISDVGPLSSLTNLRTLYLTNNQISDISPVESLPNLNNLDIKGNPLEKFVNFPDPALDEAVRQVLGKSSAGQIAKTELDEITELRANSTSITDLTGIENLTNLEKLYIYNNQITDVSPLSSLINLVVLHAGSNQVSDVSPLSSLTNLTTLYLYNNQIAYVSSLESLTNLTYLQLSGNQITDVSPLESLTSLRYLYLSNNQITDISPLASLTVLKYLSISTNYELTDLSSLGQLTELYLLDLSDMKLSEIPRLTSLMHIRIRRVNWPGSSSSRTDQANAIQEFAENRPDLRTFDILDSGINDLSVLAPLYYLTSLGVSNGEIYDLSPLSSFTNLTSLNLYSNQISDIKPLSSLTNLQYLYLYSNEISDVNPLSSLTNLRTLNLTDNEISDISPLLSLTTLQNLYLGNNLVVEIKDFSSLDSLLRVILTDNPLSQATLNTDVAELRSRGVEVQTD